MTAKTILLTGATDGIGLATARLLAAQGHQLLLHGRDDNRLAQTAQALAALPGAGAVKTFRADFARLAEADALADAVLARHPRLDVLINNAGVLRSPEPRTADGLDLRFAVNTLAPWRLTQRLLPALTALPGGRVVNLSSAAQAPVSLTALAGGEALAPMPAYAQSKLALTMWSAHLAAQVPGTVVVAVNPGSLLASKMVREGFGVQGADLGIGADIVVRAALSPDFAQASGRYYDNDARRFAPPHPDALDPQRNAALVVEMQRVLGRVLGPASPA